IELNKENPQDQEEFNQRRNRGQHGCAHDRLDRIASTLEDSGESAGLAFEMKAQRQQMQMRKNVARKAAHRMHCDIGEDRVARLIKERHQYAQGTVKERKAERTCDQARKGSAGGIA